MLTGLQNGVERLQTRSFTYSSLSPLLTAVNPESGTISYLYDNNGNLTRKTDARGIQTNFTYDALNRVTLRDYSDVTPDVSYFYDNLPNAKGRLTKVSSGVSATEYMAFDILGRVTAHRQTTDGTVYTTGYVYNLSGGLVEETYPSGRKVKNTLEADGDLARVETLKPGGAWAIRADSFSYNAAGAVTSLRLGNNRWESTEYNSRLQPTRIALGTAAGAQDVLRLDYGYGTTDNNGNVLSQTITVPTVGATAGFTATQAYTYDSLNRLKDAKEMIGATQTWKQTFVFDRYGNRNFDTANTTYPTSFAQQNITNPAVNAANNRFNGGQGWAYDAAGNTTADPNGQTFLYHAENKQTSVSNSGGTIGQFSYDGDGKRVKKVVPATGETTIFVYDASAKLVAEYSTTPSQTAGVKYLTLDTLGSSRTITDQNGNTISRRDFMPYGEEILTAQRTQGLNYTADDIRQKFTTYERDPETNLDFAQARMYSSKLGRFYSSDPLYIELGRLEDPQQINLYSYTRNNPSKFADPTGLDIEVTGETTDDFINRLQQNVSFKINRNSKTGKVQIVDDKGNVLDKKALKAVGKGLKGGEKELFKAITDGKNHAVIDAVRESGDVDFGRFDGNGHNTIDSSDLSILDNSSDNAGFTAAHVVGHETLEAYHSAINQTTLVNMNDSHNYANGFFAGIQQVADQSSATLTVASRGSIRDYSPSNFNTAPNNGVVTHASSVFNIQGTNTNIRIERQFITPVPINASLPGSTSAHIVGVRREP